MKQKKQFQDNLQHAAKVLGRKGGTIGGPARARKLTRHRRVEIAKMGGVAAAVNRHKKGEKARHRDVPD